MLSLRNYIFIYNNNQKKTQFSTKPPKCEPPQNKKTKHVDCKTKTTKYKYTKLCFIVTIKYKTKLIEL